MTDTNGLPSVNEARNQVAHNMALRVQTLKQEHETAVSDRIARIDSELLVMTRKHDEERRALNSSHQERRKIENQSRQQRFNRGLRGILDRVTGRHRQLKIENELNALKATQRDREEKDQLIFKQLANRQALDSRIDRLEDFTAHQKQILSNDLAQFNSIKEGKTTSLRPDHNATKHSTKLAHEPQL